MLDLLRSLCKSCILIFKQTLLGFHGNGANSAIFLLLEAYGWHTVKFQGREHTMGIIPFNRYLF